MVDRIIAAFFIAAFRYFEGLGVKLSTLLKNNQELQEKYKSFDDIGSKALSDLEKAKELIKQLQTKEQKDEASNQAVDDFFRSLRP